MRLLLVEDNATYGAIERRVLEEAGGECHVATSMAEAHAWLADNEADAIVLDLELSDSTGLASVRSVAAATTAPIVVVTGKPHQEDQLELLRAGADEVLDKRDNVHFDLWSHLQKVVARREGLQNRQTEPLRS